ncbi:MAG TPA: J domain-containing protein [Gaiellaceae bacterium]
MTIDAFPLCWPDGWPRRKSHQRNASKYKTTFLRARDELVRELHTGRARHVVVSTNIPLRRDGLPLANMREPEDPGVAVYWDDKHGKARVIACDVWKTVRENLRAVGLAYSSLRQIERTGASELLERAFQGFARLPESTGDCWTVLGVEKGASRERLSQRLRELTLQHHPDRGGTQDGFARITQAYHQAIGGAG